MIEEPSRLYKNEILTELGIEKMCPRCGEIWPADMEFFRKGPGKRGLDSWCRACRYEYQVNRNSTLNLGLMVSQ